MLAEDVEDLLEEKRSIDEDSATACLGSLAGWVRGEGNIVNSFYPHDRLQLQPGRLAHRRDLAEQFEPGDLSGDLQLRRGRGPDRGQRSQCGLQLQLRR
jgi:hypothetical protein